MFDEFGYHCDVQSIAVVHYCAYHGVNHDDQPIED